MPSDVVPENLGSLELEWAALDVPRNGRSYPAQLSIRVDGKLDIRVKDGVFSKHLYWTR
jgi:hypothetical protein